MFDIHTYGMRIVDGLSQQGEKIVRAISYLCLHVHVTTVC